MFFNTDRVFLFKCDSCETIISVEFEEKEDLEKLDEDKISYHCPCGGVSKVLRN